MVEDSSCPKYRSVSLEILVVCRAYESCRVVSCVATSMSLCCQCCGKCCFHEPIKIPLDLSNQSDILKVRARPGGSQVVSAADLDSGGDSPFVRGRTEYCTTLTTNTEFLYFCTKFNSTILLIKFILLKYTPSD